jgi:hypothetical protein
MQPNFQRPSFKSGFYEQYVKYINDGALLETLYFLYWKVFLFLSSKLTNIAVTIVLLVVFLWWDT